MKLSYAPLVAGLTHLVASVYAYVVMRPGLMMAEEWSARQIWLSGHAAAWQLGWWLWMLAIFAWMVFLVVVIWAYAPAHRVSTMLQSGLMLIAAILAVIGVLGWMAVLPQAAKQGLDAGVVGLIDAAVLGLLSAALLMGGAMVAWLTLDLWRLGKLPLAWLWPGLAAGLCVIPSPLLLPAGWPHLAIVGFALFIGWCIYLSMPAKWPVT